MTRTGNLRCRVVERRDIVTSVVCIRKNIQLFISTCATFETHHPRECFNVYIRFPFHLSLVLYPVRIFTGRIKLHHGHTHTTQIV